MKPKVNGVYDLQIKEEYGSLNVLEAFKKGKLRVRVSNIDDSAHEGGVAESELVMCSGDLRHHYYVFDWNTHLSLCIDAFVWKQYIVELENK